MIKAVNIHSHQPRYHRTIRVKRLKRSQRDPGAFHNAAGMSQRLCHVFFELFFPIPFVLRNIAHCWNLLRYISHRGNPLIAQWRLMRKAILHLIDFLWLEWRTKREQNLWLEIDIQGSFPISYIPRDWYGEVSFSLISIRYTHETPEKRVHGKKSRETLEDKIKFHKSYDTSSSGII